MKLKVLRVFTTLFLITLFLYKAFECLSIFLSEETVTRDYEDYQRNHPRPYICVTTENSKIRKEYF